MKNKEKNISLKEYLDIRLTELKEYFNSKFEHVEQATKLASDNLNVRLEGMNEFRESMRDMTNQYILRAEYNISKEKTDSDIRMLRETYAEAKGKASQQSVTIAYIIAASGLVIALIGVFL